MHQVSLGVQHNCKALGSIDLLNLRHFLIDAENSKRINFEGLNFEDIQSCVR